VRLLLVEDELGVVDALEYFFKKNKYSVDIATDGISGEDAAMTGVYDVIILDRMLPGREGVSILKNLRANGIKTPVLMLTAKDAIQARVEGLNAGADDYLIKPFSKDELLARVQALCRRSTDQYEENVLKCGRIELNPLKCEVTLTGKDESVLQMVNLTRKESQMLEMLIRNFGQSPYQRTDF
jgi:DNA-binding response OmpR family regulator